MVAYQETHSLPLAPGVRSTLLAHGYSTVQELQAAGSAQQLAAATGIIEADALEVLQAARSPAVDGWSLPSAVPCSTLLAAQRSGPRIVTFCQELDELLGGGVACGAVTEFCGVPGVGKTQLGIQLAVDVQIPVAFGGTGGAAVYIDTEGSFMLPRVQEIAAAAVQHVRRAARLAADMKQPGSDTLQQQAEAFTVERVLSNIHYFRAQDSTEQLALFQQLDTFLQCHANVRLVVVDSVTFHFRAETKDLGARARTLTRMAQAAMAVAEKHQAAVVYMNHVTTRVLERDQAKLFPALGESWGQAASTRVILHWQGSDRMAFLYKSPGHAAASAHYLVTAEGIRGARHAKRVAPVQ